MWREERRKEAEMNAEEGGGQKQLSKKEKQAQQDAKKKQGTRLRKQGAKANKFDAEAAGKKANKKNGLVRMHKLNLALWPASKRVAQTPPRHPCAQSLSQPRCTERVRRAVNPGYASAESGAIAFDLLCIPKLEMHSDHRLRLGFPVRGGSGRLQLCGGGAVSWVQ